MERRNVLTASITGTISAQDGKDPEAYKITVVYSDGSKTVLRKTYDEFVDLQGIVYDLLKKKAGYSRKTSRTLVSSLPELNSPLSRILFKDSDLKKMGRMDEFIKELLTLPAVITESETVMKFFGVFLEQKGTSERAEEEEKLKKINTVAEILSGRDPLREIPTHSPVPNRKTYQNAAWTPEGLRERRPNVASPLLTGRKTTASTDEEVMVKRMGSPKPGLRRRPYSVAVGLADLHEDNKDLVENIENERSQSPLGSPRSSLNDEIMERRMGSPRPGLRHRQLSDTERPQSPLTLSNGSAVELNKPRPRCNGDVSPPPENPGDTQSIEAEKKESRVRKISTHSGRQSPNKAKYVAVASFVGEETGEVSLEDGEEVEVLQKEASGWWYVKNDFGEGWAPSAFLEPAQSSRSTSPKTLSQAQIEDSVDQSKQMEEEVETVPEEPIENEDEKDDYAQENQKSLAGSSATTESQRIPPEMNRRVKFLTVEGIQKRKNPDKNYVYILKVVWSDGTINIVYRQCSDFFFLQENLRKEFPTAIGKDIPVLKGKKFTENCRFCFKDGTCKRRQFMNQFCHELINAPDNISKCQAVMTFCKPRSSDVLPHGQCEKANDKNKENEDDNVNISGPVVFEQYIAIADYKKKNKNDISLTAGDTVDVIERNDYGWWLVDREGELGWAPASHLEPVDDGTEITTSKTFAPGQEEVYQSIQSYKAQAEDELSFDVGVMLKVDEKNLDGWWHVRYQGNSGWAPAMFLKKVADSGDSTLSTSGKMDELAIVAFNGDSESEDGKGLSRTPPTRRSMVQRSVRRKPKRNSSSQINEAAIEEEAESSETAKKYERSISVPAKAYTPPPNKKLSPRAKMRSLSRPKSSEVSQGDLMNQWPHREMSISSGYGSSPTGSVSSLASDVFSPEENTTPIKKCPTLPRLENVAEQGAFHRSHSASSLVQYKKEIESSMNGRPTSSSVKSASGRSSPTPAPRKISAARRSPLASSPPKNGEFKLSPRESSSEVEYESSSDYSQKENEELMYRAAYAYISQEEGEITFNVGDVVEVIRRGENGWWLLRSSKAGVGWGPSNYLESVAY